MNSLLFGSAIHCIGGSWLYMIQSFVLPESMYSCGHFTLFATNTSTELPLCDFLLSLPGFALSTRCFSLASTSSWIFASCFSCSNNGKWPTEGMEGVAILVTWSRLHGTCALGSGFDLLILEGSLVFLPVLEDCSSLYCSISFPKHSTGPIFVG